MGISVPPPDIKVFTDHGMNAQRYIAGIREYLDARTVPLDIALIILTDNRQTRLLNSYDGLKKLCTIEFPVPIQCAKGRTITKGPSVWNKIATQMIAKVGGVPWVIDENYNHLGLDTFTAVVGIDVCHSGRQSVVGFTMSINPTFSRYFNTIRVQKNGYEELVGQMGS